MRRPGPKFLGRLRDALWAPSVRAHRLPNRRDLIVPRPDGCPMPVVRLAKAVVFAANNQLAKSHRVCRQDGFSGLS